MQVCTVGPRTNTDSQSALIPQHHRRRPMEGSRHGASACSHTAQHEGTPITVEHTPESGRRTTRAHHRYPRSNPIRAHTLARGRRRRHNVSGSTPLPGGGALTHTRLTPASRGHTQPTISSRAWRQAARTTATSKTSLALQTHARGGSQRRAGQQGEQPASPVRVARASPRPGRAPGCPLRSTGTARPGSKPAASRCRRTPSWPGGSA